MMKGFLSIDRQKRQIKLISQAEMGGKLFEIHLNDDKVDIVYASTVLKKEWLERFVAVDLKRIYFMPVLGNPVHFSEPGGRFVLVDQMDQGDNLIKEYLFSAEKSPPLRYNSFRILQNNRSVYFMDMSYGESSPYPEFITIENRANKYRLDINVRYMM